MQIHDNNRSSFKELVDQVQEKTCNPEDKYEVAAVVESIGWNDSMVNEEFGAVDVFDLAQDIYEIINSQHLVVPMVHTKKTSAFGYFIRIIRSFIRGTIFALPMAVSVLAMLTLRFSLWSYEYLSLENATAISIGTIISFMVVGGFTQAIARRGFMYLNLGYYDMARKIVYFFVRIGYIACLCASILYLIINFVFSIYPWEMAFITVLFLLFLSAIWLSVTVLYILQKELIFTGLITAGIAIVYVFFVLLDKNIIVSQIIAISIVAIASVLIAHYIFVKAERKMEKGIAPTLPRLSIIFYTSIPYFAYGFLYFTLINIDRIIAWSTNNVYMPYLIWFRGQYELGLDFALIVLMLPMGLVEVVVNELMTNLVAHEKNYNAKDAQAMNDMYLSFFVKRNIAVGIFALFNALILYIVINYLTTSGFIHLVVFANSTTLFTFIWAVLAYCMLSAALMNCLILFSLSQPKMVSHSIVVALLVDIVVGFLLSRWMSATIIPDNWLHLPVGLITWLQLHTATEGYSWAVVGLFAGSLVFTVLTTKKVKHVLKNLDYYLYTAA